ncbi:polysaccharide biosynthesis tyrosine autokinase [Halomonas sp. LR5S13]|uniref:polysaccharide biosynthesis tyrosine autokinase n=1 Tax=Halomonas rhizosphaerae TaxID=3043296 RepID=UPI0024A8DD33|nr:polysaccharide biosynthesis tyrosine autokinase [Halomonas rhizosphaerae]MDI5920873.1 polysaccharide biosynthesis tyrosine autokinase [Halomonas rhizosphaerae]
MNSRPHQGNVPIPPSPIIIQGTSSAQDGMDIARLLGVLVDHKWLILLSFLLFGLGGLIYSATVTPIYRGDTLVQVESRSSINTVGESGGVVREADNSSGVATEVQILRSRMVLGKVVDRLGMDMSIQPRTLPLIGGYIQKNEIARPDLATLPLLGDRLLASGWVQRLQDLVSHHPGVWGKETIELSRVEMAEAIKGTPLTVEVLGDGRYRLLQQEESLGVGRQGAEEAFMNGQVRLRIEEIRAPAGANFQLLMQPRELAIAQLKGRLSIMEEGATARGVSTGMLRLTLTGSDRGEIRQALDAISQTFLMQNVERQSAEAQQSLEFLEKQAPELRAQLAAAEDRMSEYRANVDSINIDSEAQSVIDQFISLERQLNELTIQESELTQRFNVNHPSYQGLMEKKRYLNAQLGRLNQRVKAMPEAQQHLIRLNRDVEVAQAIYVDVLNKGQELQLSKAGTIGNVRIIDPAVVGRTPVKPQTTVIVGAAALLGGLLSMIYVVVRSAFNRGVESPKQLEDLGIPVYATVPLSPEQARLAKWDRRAMKDGWLLAEQFPADSAVESLRGLRTSLHFAMLDAPNNCLMICGPSPDIGKSFIALNLGAVCAQGEQKVLIIDADLRKGSLHRAFGEPSKGGLSDVLTNTLGIDQAIRATEMQGLFYLSRGTAPPNPAELLMNRHFSALLDDVSSRFDLVILDTPPVLAVADAAIVGKRAGTAMMVTRFMMNPPGEIEHAIQRLNNAGIDVKGCVINGMQRKASTAYGYGYYQYQYATGRSHEDA